MNPTTRLRLRAPRTIAPKPSADAASPSPSPAMLRLALAHYIERCIEVGAITNYAEAARRLGVSRARVTQVVGVGMQLVGE